MPRHKRLNYPGCIYHVVTRGIERRKIFRDDQDREEFLSRLEKALAETGCECHAWVLMDNHLHLLIRTGERALSDLMRKVLTGYAIYFNRRHRRHGYLYQNRYKSILCQEDVYYLELIRYIHLNPVRAGIVKTLKQLDRYPWTGHAFIVGTKKNKWQSIDDVLVLFAKRAATSIKRYKAYINEGFNQGRRPELVGGGLLRSVGGWGGVKALRAARENWRGDERILGDSDFVVNVLRVHEEKLEKRAELKLAGWDMDRLCSHVCKMFSIKPDQILRKGRENNVSRAKNILSFWANRELGISGKEIADYFGVSGPAISYSIKQGEKYARQNDINLPF